MTPREHSDWLSRNGLPGTHDMSLAHTLECEGTEAAVTTMPGRVMLVVRQRNAAPADDLELRIELTPTTARALGADLFACSHKAEEILEKLDGGRWDCRR